jgi:hypothetical protein
MNHDHDDVNHPVKTVVAPNRVIAPLCRALQYYQLPAKFQFQNPDAWFVKLLSDCQRLTGLPRILQRSFQAPILTFILPVGTTRGVGPWRYARWPDGQIDCQCESAKLLIQNMRHRIICFPYSQCESAAHTLDLVLN